MNGDYTTGLSRNAKIAIIVGATVVVVGLVVGVALFFRARANPVSRSRVTATKQSETASEPSVRQPPSIDQVKQMEELNAKAIREFLKTTVVKVDDSNIVYDVEQIMTNEEKQRYGFPLSADVRFKYVHPDPTAPVQVPIMVITKAPEPKPSPPPSGRQPAKKPSQQ